MQGARPEFPADNVGGGGGTFGALTMTWKVGLLCLLIVGSNANQRSQLNGHEDLSDLYCQFIMSPAYRRTTYRIDYLLSGAFCD